MNSTVASVTSTALSAVASATSSNAGGHGGVSSHGRPPIYKAVGVSLAVASGAFIGVSFVLKKKGLLAANVKDGKEAGEGYGYLRNAWWWTGMVLMILGEICNFCAYAFVEAILVTPLGALSVVITAILSSIFLGERLSFVGKIGCFMCIIGSIVIVINAPEQSSVSTIQDMKRFILSPGFLVYASIIIVACVCIVVWVAPKYGKKSMLVYLSVCSLIGGLSVVATQGLGAAVVTQIAGTPQFNQWFLYILFVFVIATLVVEIVYLNKALNIFNAALVTPTYYVFFTSSTIITSAILFRGFKGTPSSIATVVMGFLQICSGVVLLQLSKSAKDVPDTEIFRGDLDQVRTVAEMSEPESEPKADAIRGTAAIIRRMSMARQMAEAEEARRIREDKIDDMLNGPTDSVEWDGVRRRLTRSANGTGASPRRRNTTSGARPPLGMSRMPDLEEGVESTPERSAGRRRSLSVDEAMRTQVYGIQPEHEPTHPAGIVERVKSLFITKQRSQASLRSGAGDPAIPYRDTREAGGPPPRIYADSESPPSLPLGRGKTRPYSPGAMSLPRLNVPLPPPDDNTKSRDFGASSSKGQLPRARELIRTTSGESEYTAIPTMQSTSPPHTIRSVPSTPNTQGLRPPSSNSTSSAARRQFSFQRVFGRHSRSRSGSSSTHPYPNTDPASESAMSTHSAPSHLHLPRIGIGSRGYSAPAAGVPQTEEEMLGLVKGDSAGAAVDSDDEKAPTATVRRVDSESEDEVRRKL